MSLAHVVEHHEIKAGEGVQLLPADGVRGLHGADVNQRLVVGADQQGAMLNVVSVVFHEVEDGHQLAIGGIVVGLRLPQPFHPVGDHPLVSFLNY